MPPTHLQSVHLFVLVLVSLACVSVTLETELQQLPALTLSCDALNNCYCAQQSQPASALPSTMLNPDASLIERSNLQCSVSFFAFTLRVTDGGTLGDSAFQTQRATELSQRLTDLIANNRASGNLNSYTYCAVTSWFKTPPQKPSFVNGTCMLACVDTSAYCSSAFAAFNDSLYTVPSFYPSASSPNVKLPIRVKSVALVDRPASFRIPSSALQIVDSLLPTTTVRRLHVTTTSAFLESDDENDDNLDDSDTNDRGLAATNSQSNSEGTDAENDAEDSNASVLPASSSASASADDALGSSILNDPRRALTHPGVLVALGAAGLLVVSLSVLLVLFTVKRVRKRDRGSYVLDDAHRKAPLLTAAHAHVSSTTAQMYNGYPSPPAREFYA